MNQRAAKNHILNFFQSVGFSLRSLESIHQDCLKDDYAIFGFELDNFLLLEAYSMTKTPSRDEIGGWILYRRYFGSQSDHEKDTIELEVIGSLDQMLHRIAERLLRERVQEYRNERDL